MSSHPRYAPPAHVAPHGGPGDGEHGGKFRLCSAIIPCSDFVPTLFRTHIPDEHQLTFEGKFTSDGVKDSNLLILPKMSSTQTPHLESKQKLSYFIARLQSEFVRVLQIGRLNNVGGIKMEHVQG